MGVKTMTLTLPEDLFELVEGARVRAQLSQSEVVQAALRSYLGQPAAALSEEEQAALDRAIRDLKEHPDSGRHWDQVLEGLSGTE